MKFTLSCYAADPVAECSKTKTFNLPREAMEVLVAKHAERGGVCSKCFAAGKVAKANKPQAQRSVRSDDPNRLVTVVCSNVRCRHGEEISPRVTMMVQGEEVVVREQTVKAVKARITCTVAEATKRPLCEACEAEALAEEKKAAAKAKRAQKKAQQ